MSKTLILIDGANFYTAAKLLNIEVDYLRLRNFLREEFAPNVRINYYSAIVTNDNEHQPLRGLFDWLEYNGFRMVTKPAKTLTRPDGSSRIKGNMDVEIAVDAIQGGKHCDRVVLFTGDGDFAYLIRELQRSGVTVYVCSTVKSTPPVASDDLRRAADQFIELAEIEQYICKQTSRGETANV